MTDQAPAPDPAVAALAIAKARGQKAMFLAEAEAIAGKDLAKGGRGKTVQPLNGFSKAGLSKGRRIMRIIGADIRHKPVAHGSLRHPEHDRSCARARQQTGGIMSKTKLTRCGSPGCRTLGTGPLCHTHQAQAAFDAQSAALLEQARSRLAARRADLDQLRDGAEKLARRAEQPIFSTEKDHG